MKDIIDPKLVESYLGQKLHAFPAEQLAWAFNAKENIILFGPGGYAKSQAAVMFNDLLYQEGLVTSPKPYVLSFGQGMTEERLLGGLDVKKFTDLGEIAYLLKNAFIEHEIVIFEEMFDAFPGVLLILKDILQSKEVRMGAQQVPIKTKMVIACTNRSRSEVVSDLSTEALMERFIFEVEVKWSSYTAGDYAEALCKATGDDYNQLMDCIANISAKSGAAKDSKVKISPRTAVKAYYSAKVNGLISLTAMYGFAHQFVRTEIDNWEVKAKNLEQLTVLQTAYKEAKSIYDNSKKRNSGVKIMSDIKAIENIRLKTNETPIRDANTEYYKNLLNKLDKYKYSLFNLAKTKIVNPKPGTFAYKIKENNNLNDLLKITHADNEED